MADDPMLLLELRASGVTIFNYPTAATTTFRNKYAPANADIRHQCVDAIGGRLTVANIPPISAKIWQVGPLSSEDLDHAIIAHCARIGGTVAIDIQGLTRSVVGSDIRPRGLAWSPQYLRHVGILKADAGEILLYTGSSTIAEAVAKIQHVGPQEVLVTLGSQGCGRQCLEIPAVSPRRSVDATGCGDTFLAAYVVSRLAGADARERGDFASVVASLTIENPGGFQGSAATIADRRNKPRQTGADRDGTAAA